ncbi:unnamed protein product [Parascedosporium putredinis]|uniref:Uncharacterized protein n=1 Tax=Parascedosporium putredinis TaxID=1442378 RepID=A0A9P1H8Z3_9PEZI|nr:unnamed protein product [Parascedosporium putredinis]CAI8002556.1 unnamed protein product [Parascedosporium putredinis]
MVSKREFEQDNSTLLDKSWVDAILLTFPQDAFPISRETEVTGNVGVETAVEIVCTHCYIKGRATSKFTIDDGDFDFGQTIANFTKDIGETILDIGEQILGNVTQYFTNLFDNFDDGIDLEDFAFPPMELDFNVEVAEIPECRLDFKFEDIELYLSISTILSSSATYNLNLYTSNTPIGLSVGRI